MRIEIAPILEAFDDAIALVEDPEQRARLQRVLRAAAPAVESAATGIVRAMAAEVNEVAGGAVHAEVVHGADGPELRVEARSPMEPSSTAPDLEFDASEIERLTLRLPSELKEIAAIAAQQAGVSLNAWLTRVVSQEAGRRRGRAGRGTGRSDHGVSQTLKGWIG
ncbi:MAG: toxin-antitoxin system HicB family antitoxin [Chloroflexi bacterium]|nr:toxin-antitoxin system HicB family antitoxin [Chloroflexota bacterium]